MVRFLANAQIESRASSLWRLHKLSVGFDVEALLDSMDLGMLWSDEVETEVLGLLIPVQRLVVINESHRRTFERNPGLYRFTIGHEIGHWMLHCEDARASNMELIAGDRILCRQGSREPIEIQAERFASYLLAPTDQLRPRMPPQPWHGWTTVYGLANSFGMSPSAMIVRLQEAKLAYRDDAGIPRSGHPVAVGQLDLGLE